MSRYEQKMSFDELSLKDEIEEIFDIHSADVYQEPGFPLADIPERYMLMGRIKNLQGPSTHVVLEINEFRNGGIMTLLIIADQEYIIGDSGVIYIGDPSADSQMDDVVNNLRYWVRETTWENLASEMSF